MSHTLHIFVQWDFQQPHDGERKKARNLAAHNNLLFMHMTVKAFETLLLALRLPVLAFKPALSLKWIKQQIGKFTEM